MVARGPRLLLAEMRSVHPIALGSTASLPLEGRDRGWGSVSGAQNDPHPGPPLKGEGTKGCLPRRYPTATARRCATINPSAQAEIISPPPIQSRSSGTSLKNR
ncbi:hypothetical protein SAMN02745223_01589 [Devosia limi DSM 17137]|uniref:Uncharacterized protein n=1 Tax=Devosia limi DSM 17137 TaxID=1121477 RepID=A0A1M4Y8K2_9HYPH|nr:hypothetical protein SAMN02745223_01589 [Devosia limi DSM 17137]